jgi:hypothetical protein
MRLYLFGTDHHDPKCPSELSSKLQTVKDLEISSPAYLAVESDQSHCTEILSQRDHFCEIAKVAWPSASNETLETLASTFVFEAAIPPLLFPGVKIVWLDEGRDLPEPDAISRFAEKRLCLFKSFLGSLEIPSNHDSAINYLSSASRLIVRGAQGGDNDPRDEKWARILEGETPSATTDWAIVVVGAHHIERRSGNVADRLEAAGLDLTRFDLTGVVDMD